MTYDCHQTVNVNESSWQQLELSLPRGKKLRTFMENRPFLFDQMTLACPGWGKLSPQRHDAFCKTGSSIGWASKKSGRENFLVGAKKANVLLKKSCKSLDIIG